MQTYPLVLDPVADDQAHPLAAENLVVLTTQNCIEDTPIMLALPHAWVEFTKKSPGDMYMPFSGDDSGIALMKGPDVVAFMTWSDRRGKTAWITMGWVAPEWRNKGLYKIMWDEFLAFIEPVGYHAVFGSTGVDNKAMQRVMEQTDREAVGILYKLDMIKYRDDLLDAGVQPLKHKV